VQWLDSAGKLEPLLAKPGAYARPQVSPDGKRLALDNGSDIWTYDWQRDVMTRLTFNGGNGSIWSPDSRFVLYCGNGGIGWTRSDGGSAPQTLIQNANPLYPWSFSPDGKRLAYLEITGEGYDLYTASIENDGTTLKAGKPETLLKTSADERYPQFSPDGRWMMYASDESGTFQVYVRAFPDKGAKWQISSGGGTYPEWSSDRRTIVFRSLDHQIMAVTYTASGDAFTAEKPRLWADQRLAEVSQARNYGMHPDGKRIAALMPAGSQASSKDATHVTILFNFFDELKRRVSAGK
jgi:serine/threonine-protein kinase